MSDIEIINNACNKHKTGVIHSFYSSNNGQQNDYNIDSEGQVFLTSYKVVSVENCSCFGCSLVLEKISSDLVYNCNEFIA